MADKKKRILSRREFIANTGMAAIGSSLLLGSPSRMFSSSGKGKLTDVVLIRDKEVLDAQGKPRARVVQAMLDKAVVTLTGKKDAVAGWKTFIKPDDMVGIKTNIWKPIGTTGAVEQALKKRVMDVGVPSTDIIIQDRGTHRNNKFQKTTALINARPMRSHHWSGVGSLIKNYVNTVPDPYNHHEDSCADLGKIWHMAHIKDKTRLNVLVMFTPQFHNVGPHGFSPRHVWKYYGLLVGFDPVAIDSLGLQIIQAQRKIYFAEDRPLNPPAKHIQLADTRHHLGTADRSKINLIKLGYAENILV